MSQPAWQRWAPLSGVVFVALMIIGFIVAGSSPDAEKDSNAEIAAYLAKDSEQTKNIVAFFILMAAMLFLVSFFAALRSRLTLEEGGLGRLGNLAFGAGIASTVFLITAISIFVTPVITADFADFPVDPGLYRLTQVFGYLLWVASTVVGAIVAWATAAVVLQTRSLPRWVAWFSIVVGVICLAAFMFFPIFLFWLWIVIVSILLFVRPVTVTVQPTAPVAGSAT